VAVDDTAGVARLTWTRYEGDQLFTAYWVLRSVAKSTEVDTLQRLLETGETSYADTSRASGVAYVYRVAVVNDEGFAASSMPVAVAPLKLPPVEIVRVEVDSRTATATVEWTPYRGPRFSAYQVRRSSGDGSRIVAEITDIASTLFVDRGLAGNTLYSYQIAARTEREEEVVGDPERGILHPLVATWDVPIEGDGADVEQVRVYAEADGQISVLLAGDATIRWLAYDSEGRLLAEQMVLDLPALHGYSTMNQYLVAGARDAQGRRFLTVGKGGEAPQAPAVVQVSADGDVRTRERVVLAAAVPDSLDGDARVVGAEIALVLGRPGQTEPYDVAFRSVAVWSGDEMLYAHDFSSWPQGYHEAGTQLGDWALPLGRHLVSKDWLWGVDRSVAGISDPSWLDCRLEVDMITTGASGAIRLGGGRYSELVLRLSPRNQLATLELLPPGEGEAAVYLEEAIPVVAGVPYHLSLEAAGGQLTGIVSDPIVWTNNGVPSGSPRMSMAVAGGGLAITLADQAYFLDEDMDGTTLSPFEGWVNETRAWRVDGESRDRMAICLPMENKVRWGLVFGASRWASGLRSELRRIDHEVGGLYYPTSMDGSPDGRMYVLDAGNGRILSFDGDGRYVTQWGEPGSSRGEFDFGDGLRLQTGLNYAGSICVDDDGFIYVADVYNRRIQKFSPN